MGAGGWKEVCVPCPLSLASSNYEMASFLSILKTNVEEEREREREKREEKEERSICKETIADA